MAILNISNCVPKSFCVTHHNAPPKTQTLMDDDRELDKLQIPVRASVCAFVVFLRLLAARRRLTCARSRASALLCSPNHCSILALACPFRCDKHALAQLRPILEEYTCAICYELISDTRLTPCGHIFCAGEPLVPRSAPCREISQRCLRAARLYRFFV